MQTNIYEFLEVDTDPLFMKIESLKNGQSFVVENYEVLMNNFDFYEIFSCSSHEVFSTKEKCYKKLCEIVSNSSKC